MTSEGSGSSSSGSNVSNNSSGGSSSRYGGKVLGWDDVSDDASDWVATDEEVWAGVEAGKRAFEGVNWDEELKNVTFY